MKSGGNLEGLPPFLFGEMARPADAWFTGGGWLAGSDKSGTGFALL